MAGGGVDWQRQIELAPEKLLRLTGIDLPAADQKSILESLGFTLDSVAAGWLVTPPSWRGDIDGAADLVEAVVDRAGDKGSGVEAHHDLLARRKARGGVAAGYVGRVHLEVPGGQAQVAGGTRRAAGAETHRATP